MAKVRDADWDDRTPHDARHIPALAQVKMLLALAVPVPFHKYSPDQPRVPAGNSDGGQWTDGDGERGSTTHNRTGTAQGMQHPSGLKPTHDIPSDAVLYHAGTLNFYAPPDADWSKI